MPVDGAVHGRGAAVLGRGVDRRLVMGQHRLFHHLLRRVSGHRDPAGPLGQAPADSAAAARDRKTTARASGPDRADASRGARRRLVPADNPARHRPLVEAVPDPAHRLAVGADDAAERVRRRRAVAGARVQLGVEPMAGRGPAVHRVLLVRADGHLPDRALPVAGGSDVSDRPAQHRAHRMLRRRHGRLPTAAKASTPCAKRDWRDRRAHSNGS